MVDILNLLNDVLVYHSLGSLVTCAVEGHNFRFVNSHL